MREAEICILAPLVTTCLNLGELRYWPTSLRLLAQKHAQREDGTLASLVCWKRLSPISQLILSQSGDEKSEIQWRCSASGSSGGESAPCTFQLLVAPPGCGHITLISAAIFMPPFPLRMKTHHITPGDQLLHLKILNWITSAKAPFPNKVAFPGSRVWMAAYLFSGPPFLRIKCVSLMSSTQTQGSTKLGGLLIRHLAKSLAAYFSLRVKNDLLPA